MPLRTPHRKKKRIPPPKDMFDLDKPIKLNRLASFIATHKLLSGSYREARDKAYKRLKYAEKKAKLSTKNGCTTLRNFIIWMTSTRGWSNNPSPEFTRLPRVIRPKSIGPNAAVGNDITAISIPLPYTIEECHEEIRKAYRRIAKLETK
jgi:hypothetical protein